MGVLGLEAAPRRADAPRLRPARELALLLRIDALQDRRVALVCGEAAAQLLALGAVSRCWGPWPGPGCWPGRSEHCRPPAGRCDGRQGIGAAGIRTETERNTQPQNAAAAQGAGPQAVPIGPPIPTACRR